MLVPHDYHQLSYQFNSVAPIVNNIHELKRKC